MKAPHWIVGYEIDGKLFGKRSKNSIERNGVIFYTFSSAPMRRVSILEDLSKFAKLGDIQLMSAKERIPYVSAELNSSINLYSLLRRMEFTICEILDAEAASILVHKGDHLEFMVTAGGASGRIESIPVPMNSIAGTIFNEEKTMIFNDLEKSGKHFKGVDKASGFVTRNILGSPIWAGDLKFGVIEILNKEGGFTEEDAEVLELFAKLIGRKLYSTIENENFMNLMKDIFLAIATALDKRDNYTHSHSRNVALYSVAIGRKLGLSEKELEELEISAILHDVGKIGVPDGVLLKPGRLTKEEFELIKLHPVIGGEILSKIKYATENLVAGALEHHERLDGSGYPYGKKDGEITLFGRIIAVADMFDAITAKRVYKGSVGVDKTFEILDKEVEKGKLDVEIVKILKEIIHVEGVSEPEVER